jgi:long-chain fatty acid transport protein
MAMGGTGAAHVSNYDAAFANPALASRMRRYKLSLGFQGGTFDLHANGQDLPDKISALPAHGLTIGGDLPLPFGGILRDRVGVALAFYTPSDVLVRGRILYPETPQFGLFPDRAQCLTVRAGFGVDIGHGIRLGAGFGALAEIVGSVVVATDSTGRVGSRVEDQLITTYAPTFGASWEHELGGGTLRVGATFRGKLDARFAVLIDATKLSSLPIPLLNIAGLAQYDPLQVALEGAWEKGPWRFAAGFTYKHWGDYPGPWEPTIQCPADAPDCGALSPAKLEFGDTIVPRVGAERKFPISADSEAALRAGWFLEPTPAPGTLPSSKAYSASLKNDIDVPTRFFDATRSVFTLGGGIRIHDVTLDGFTQLHVIVPRDEKMLFGQTGATKATLTGTALAAGLVLGVSF